MNYIISREKRELQERIDTCNLTMRMISYFIQYCDTWDFRNKILELGTKTDLPDKLVNHVITMKEVIMRFEKFYKQEITYIKKKERKIISGWVWTKMLWGEEVLKKHTRMTNYLKRVKYGPKQRIFWEEIENLKDKLEQTDIINDTIEYDYSEIGDDYFHKIQLNILLLLHHGIH